MSGQTPETNPTRTIKASEFKAKCLALMDEVAAEGGEIVITKFGRPVAKLTPVSKPPGSFYGKDRHRIKITGDILSPIDVEWEAQQNPDRVPTP